MHRETCASLCLNSDTLACMASQRATKRDITHQKSVGLIVYRGICRRGFYELAHEPERDSCCFKEIPCRVIKFPDVGWKIPCYFFG